MIVLVVPCKESEPHPHGELPNDWYGNCEASVIILGLTAGTSLSKKPLENEFVRHGIDPTGTESDTGNWVGSVVSENRRAPTFFARAANAFMCGLLGEEAPCSCWMAANVVHKHRHSRDSEAVDCRRCDREFPAGIREVQSYVEAVTRVHAGGVIIVLSSPVLSDRLTLLGTLAKYEPVASGIPGRLLKKTGGTAPVYVANPPYSFNLRANGPRYFMKAMPPNLRRRVEQRRKEYRRGEFAYPDLMPLWEVWGERIGEIARQDGWRPPTHTGK